MNYKESYSMFPNNLLLENMLNNSITIKKIVVEDPFPKNLLLRLHIFNL